MTEALAVVGVSALIVKFTSTVVAMILLHLFLSFWDLRSGIPFKVRMETMCDDPRAIAQYHSYRILGVGLFCGIVFAAS